MARKLKNSFRGQHFPGMLAQLLRVHTVRSLALMQERGALNMTLAMTMSDNSVLCISSQGKLSSLETFSQIHHNTRVVVSDNYVP